MTLFTKIPEDNHVPASFPSANGSCQEAFCYHPTRMGRQAGMT
jgi:hypothetical protein